MFLAKNAALLEAFKRGEREAMDEVYRHYHPGLAAFLRRGFSFQSSGRPYFFKGIKDPAELEAAVQEVFRRLFEAKARASYNGSRPFSNWMLAIARNMAINQFRNREVALSDSTRDGDERGHLAALDAAVTPEFSGLLYGESERGQDARLESDELRALVARFLGGLPQLEQRLLLLRFADGKGQAETAGELASTRMKVRIAEARLRKRLRVFLRGSGYLEGLDRPKGRRRGAAAATEEPGSDDEGDDGSDG
jgi:RNA polymerase sigma factor (sigma-70 family)